MTDFTCDDAVVSCGWVGERIVAGEHNSRVHVFAWEE
jgi:hypothetical protein